MRGAYLLARTLRGWDATAVSDWIDRAVAAGIDTVLTKATSVDAELARHCHARGLEVIGSFACFTDHDAHGSRGEVLRPMTPDGREFAPMEWYLGIAPTSPGYVDRLETELDGILRERPWLDGIALDFLRWPLHWELELREDRTPRRSSYDPVTLGRFATYLGRDVPTDAPEAATWIDAEAGEEWTAFRIAVITGIARRLVTRIRAADRGTAMFVVPAEPADRLEILGQDLVALGGLVDRLIPMTYHAILHRDPAWPGAYATAMGGDPSRAVPMIQLTADAVLAAGADWGDPVTVDDVAAAIAGLPDPGRFCLFPGEALDEPLVHAIASHRSTTPSTPRRITDLSSKG